MDTQDGDVSADHGLSHEGRQHRGVVTDVAFAGRDVALAHNLGDTLNDVIFTLGVTPSGTVGSVGAGMNLVRQVDVAAARRRMSGGTQRVVPDPTQETHRVGGRNSAAHNPRSYPLVRRIGPGVRRTVSTARRRRHLHPALRRPSDPTVTTRPRTRATSRASRTARSSARRTSTTPVRRTTGATRPRCARSSTASSKVR